MVFVIELFVKMMYMFSTLLLKKLLFEIFRKHFRWWILKAYDLGWYQDICKKWKRTEDSEIDHKYIQPRFRDWIWHFEVCHDDNERLEKRKNGRKRTAKSEKNPNTQKEEKFQILRNIGSRHHQTNIKEEIRKEYHGRTKKPVKTKFYGRNLIKGMMMIFSQEFFFS